MVTLAEPAATKTIVTLKSSDGLRVLVPAGVAVPARANGASFQVRSLHATSTANITITASLDGAVKTVTVDVSAADGSEPLPAPVLVAPAYGARGRYYGGPNEFTWASVAGAASYTIQLSPDRSFDSAAAVSRTVPSPSVNITPVGSALWWRVCANDANGSPGLWSMARRLGYFRPRRAAPNPE
jgi:hypothetical protein